jgi:UDP-N-acetylglucosamine--N-acetylmuramyl-(pentapeptide) pyrophosphoryl-undecaprenol N-acetylglucosamine transferase
LSRAATIPKLLKKGNFQGVVHLTGDNDPEADNLQHPQYIALPFYDNMAALLKRGNLAISCSGAGSLTEMAVCGLLSIWIPY